MKRTLYLLLVLTGCGSSQLSTAQLQQLASQVEQGAQGPSGLTGASGPAGPAGPTGPQGPAGSGSSGASSNVACAGNPTTLGAGEVTEASYQIVTFGNGDRLIVCGIQLAAGFYATNNFDTVSTSFTVYSSAGTNTDDECDIEFSFASNNTGGTLQFTTLSSVHQVQFVNPSKPSGTGVGVTYTFSGC